MSISGQRGATTSGGCIIVSEDVAARRLIHVLPQWRPRAGILHAAFPSRRGLLPSVRALLDFLARECAAERRKAERALGDPG